MVSHTDQPDDSKKIITETKQYLTTLFGGCDDGSVIFATGERVGTRSKWTRQAVMPTPLTDEVVDEVAKVVFGSTNLFVKPNLFHGSLVTSRSPHAVGKRSELSHVTWVSLDVDCGKQNFPERDEMLHAMLTSPLPPTMLVGSDGDVAGLHYYLRLSEGVRIESDSHLRHLQAVSKAVYETLLAHVESRFPETVELRRKAAVIDPTSGLERFLRVVGSMRASGRRTLLLSHDGPTYDLSKLEELLPKKKPIKEKKPSEQKKSCIPYSAGSTVNVDRWLARNAVNVIATDQVGSDRHWYIECPHIDSHTTANGPKDCRITQDANGRLGGCCFHSSCGMNSWSAIRDAIGAIDMLDIDRPVRLSKPSFDGVFELADPKGANDSALADRFIRQHGDDIRFVPEWGCWIAWDEFSQWRINADETVRSLIEGFAKKTWEDYLEIERSAWTWVGIRSG